MTIEWVGVDADDTLWHNESYFTDSSALFAELAIPYLAHADDPERAAHDLLIATERRNIPMFGYGIKGATLSMIEAALEVSGLTIAPADIYRLVERAKTMMGHPVEFLDGAVEALDALASFRLILITKGDVMDQRRKVELSEISPRFDAVEILHEKDADTYLAVLGRHGISPESFVMIGNSLRSDVLPVLDLGAAAIHVPYTSTWALETAVEPTGHPRFRLAHHISHTPELVRTLDTTPKGADPDDHRTD